MRLHSKLLAALSTLCLAGCAPVGAIFTLTTRPLDVDLNATELSSETGRANVKTLTIYYMRFMWGGNGIAQIAKARGFTRVHYADIQTLSVLGVWTQEWVIIYGERAP